MRVDSRLKRVIEASEPYWAAEAQVVRSYWDSPVRNRETDLLWIARQAYKEFWDGFVAPLERLHARYLQVDRGMDRAEALDLAETLYEELEHYRVFAEAYETISGESCPDPDRMQRECAWAENDALMDLRAAHKREHPVIGARAHLFTEGGYCTLYAEGMALEGRGGVDDVIAEACALVHADEFDHMLKGILGLTDEGLGEAEWTRLEEMTVEQMQHRIRMRNVQFSNPVAETDLAAWCAGSCSPMAFDYTRAGLVA